MLGTAGLPHILMRFYTVPTAKEARRSVVWAIWLIGVFYLFTLVLGYGAAALRRPGHDQGGTRRGELGGPAAGLRSSAATLLLGLIAAVAFATILAVVAGLTITASRLVRARHLRQRHQARARSTPDDEVRVARITAVVIGIVAILGGILANGQNIAFLVALAFAVAASANLPTILYSLFWRRFNTTGALWSIYGGLTISLVLIVFSPGGVGQDGCAGNRPAVDVPRRRLPLVPAGQPGHRVDPAVVPARLPRHGAEQGEGRPGLYAEMEVRSLTGVGAAKATVH